MKTLRIAQAALALILVVGISSNSFAFMVEAAGQSILIKTTPSQMVESLRAEMEAGETQCEEMLAKLNAALDEIDARLDIGVPNEGEFLAARQAIVEMKYDLECVATTLTAQVVTGGAAASGIAGAAGAAAGAAPAVTAAGGTGMGAVGGGSMNGLAQLGIIGGGVAAISSNSDSPGFVASQALAN